MTIYDLLAPAWDGISALPNLGPFVRAHGVDVCAEGLPDVVPRGTPVYVTADANPLEVQRRMAEVHARMLFVLDVHDAVIGIVDICDLAARAEELRWPHPPRRDVSA